MSLMLFVRLGRSLMLLVKFGILFCKGELLVAYLRECS
jgi:hypothetical protein